MRMALGPYLGHPLKVFSEELPGSKDRAKKKSQIV